ncbi:hypothetical protein [Agromyces sp. H66]|uniref:hypothetical protein n=1 Tax=Agromyces sp. H66 TaxID=2529859 RepID=UPI0032C123FC
MTLRLAVHPDDGHGTTLVSGMSREMSGPASRSRSSTSLRNESLSRSHAALRSHVGQVAISGR